MFPLEAPALRQRKDDIQILVEYFVKRYASRAGKIIRSIGKKTLELLQSYDWSGNIRELQNVVERSVILTSGDTLAVDESWLSKDSSQPLPRSQASRPHTDGEREERLIIEAALRESKGRVAGPMGAAAKLRIPPLFFGLQDKDPEDSQESIQVRLKSLSRITVFTTLATFANISRLPFHFVFNEL